MDVISELLKPYNLLYIAPIAVAGTFLVLRRVGIEVDIFGALDTAGEEATDRLRSPRLRQLVRWLLPSQELDGLRITLFAAGWASTGLALNHGLRASPLPFLHFFTFFGACLAGFWASAIGTRLVNYLLPSAQKTTSMEDLVGLSAVVISDQIDATLGRARVKDGSENTITVFCRHIGEGEFPTYGSTVTLVRYDLEERIFDVMP